MVASAVALGLLVALRTRVALGLDPSLDAAFLWDLQAGEVQFWAAWALVGALLLHWSPRRPGGVLFVGATGLLLAISALELAFCEVTGSRVDFEVLGFFWEDLGSVWMLARSELRWVHPAALVASLLVAWLPWRFGPAADPAWSRVLLVPLFVPFVGWGLTGRPRSPAPFTELQPSLVEQLWWDGLGRLGDDVLDPDPADLVPLAVERRAEGPLPNVVVVFLESIGAGATTLHVPDQATTPTLAGLAANGLWAEDASTVVPHTSKSLATALCGEVPQLVRDIREARPGGVKGPCLPALLAGLGYRTAFFQTARDDYEQRAELVHFLGFHRFFGRDAWGDVPDVNYFGAEDRVMLAPGLAWSTDAPGPFLAVYNTLVSHHDYTVPRGFRTRAWPGAVRGRGRYLNAVRYVDDFVDRLVDAHRAAGLLDRTVFVFIGDHGEAFGEHGRNLHDLVLWEEGVHVPLVIWGPTVLGGRTGRIEGPRSALDLVPTILELVGVEVTQGAPRGMSLLGPVPTDRVLHHSCWRSHRCLAERRDRTKLIHHYGERPDELFDLVADPGETQNLAVPGPALDARLAELEAWRGRNLGQYLALEEAFIAAQQAPSDSPAVATWGGRMGLLGCAPVSEEVVPGESLWLSCQWRVAEKLDTSWQVRTRLGGSVEAAWRPRMSTWPTWKWPVGYAVADSVRIRVPQDAAPGPLGVEVGWERSGLALTDESGEEWREVATVQVRPFPTDRPAP